MENKTIYDIAEEAKVSVATVSRVLTGSAPVRAETKKKIMKVIDKYGFRPNGLARSLLNKQSKMIGFVLPDISNPFFSTLVLKSEAYALELGYTSFLCNTMNDKTLESKYLENLLDKQVDGIIFLGGRINDTHTIPEYAVEMQHVMNRMPVVFINGRMENVDAHIVRTDESSGIFKIVELLTNLGHTEIGLLGGTIGISSKDMKTTAFKEALEEYGVVLNEDWIIDDGFSIKSGEEVAARLMNESKKPTAVICINDFVAIGVIKMFQKHGVRVPEDISVIGFDDIYLADDFYPGITTISQNYSQLGKSSVDVLHHLIQGKSVSKETIVPTMLIARDTHIRKSNEYKRVN